MHECMEATGMSDDRDNASPIAAEGPRATEEPDWTLVRSFIAVMREGSLTAAATVLGTTQPTVGRHVRDLERLTGDALFERHGQRLVPTERAQELFENAVRVERDMTALGRAFVEPLGAVAGTVRVTTSEIFAVHVLPDLLRPLLERHSELTIEVISSNAVDDLVRRDADIAVRFVRPVQPDLVARTVGEIALGLYASASYIEANEEPHSLPALLEHRMVTAPGAPEVRAFARERDIAFDRLRFALQSDSLLVRQSAVRAGIGIGPLHRWIGDSEASLTRVLPNLALPPLPIWLTSHADLKRSRRLRMVFDHIADGLKERFDRKMNDAE